MKNIILDEKNICNEYLNTTIGIMALSKKYNTFESNIRDILYRNKIQIKRKGKQELKINYIVNDYRIKKYIDTKDYHFEVIDNNTNFQSTDINNKGGHLTSYIKRQYNVTIPTLYYRRQYYKTTGNYWWEQWLTYIKVQNNIEVKKCPYCDWETIDIKNNSGAFEVHLKKCHNLSKLAYIEKHPEDKPYFYFANPTLQTRFFEENPCNFIRCKICGSKVKHISKNHLALHNITKEDYIKKYGNELVCKDTHDRLSEIAIKTNSNMPIHKDSYSEAEIKDFINNLGFEAKQDRTILNGRELDIYIPLKEVAFEYNGLYWHNELYKSKTYHLDKTIECKNKGVTLYHIFEDEWLHHSDIIKSNIKSILGVEDCTISANDCTIKEIDTLTTNLFLETNDIFGKCKATYKYGLFLDETLVYVIAISKIKLTENINTCKIIRLCNKKDTKVIGGAEKLLKHFIDIEHPSKIISECDIRWNCDILLKKLGFVFKKAKLPKYFYVIDDKRETPNKYTKEFLIKQGFDKTKTTSQIMKERKIYKIYDCGSSIYEKNC